MRKIKIVCVLLLLLVLSGCRKEDPVQSESTGTGLTETESEIIGLVPPVYKVEDAYTIKAVEGISVYHIFDGKVYYLKTEENSGDWNTSLCSIERTGEIKECPIEALSKIEYKYWCLSQRDGKDILATLSKSDNGYCITVIDISSGEAKTINVDNDSIHKRRIKSIEAYGDKSYILASYENLYVTDENGKVNDNIIYTPERYSVFASDKDVAMMNSQTLYSFNLETQEMNQAAYLTDCKIGHEQVIDVLENEGRYYVLTEDDGDITVSILSLSEVQERKEKAKLLLYQPFFPTVTQEEVDKFNFGNEDYEIVLDKDRCDPSLRFIKETKPDIVIMPCYETLSMPYYERQGFFVNLIPYIEKSEKIKLDDLNGALVKAFGKDDKLFALSERIAYQVPMVYEEVDISEYNTQNAVEILRDAAKEKGLESSMSTSSYMELLFTGILDDILHDDSGNAKMNRRLVKDGLERIKKATDGIEEKDSLNMNSSERDTCFLTRPVIENMADVSKYVDGYSMKLSGYPTLDGTSVYMQTFSEIMCISSFTEHPEGAFKFIEYMMTRSELYGNQQGSIFSLNSLNQKGRFPGTLAGYTELLPVTVNIAGDEFEVEFTDANAEILKDLSENVVFDNMLKWDVFDVLAEEAEPYFEGAKSIDEVLDIIENRVNLILAENN